MILLALHALASWLFWLERYEDLRQEPLTFEMAVAGLAGVWGLLLVWLGGWWCLSSLLRRALTGRDAWMHRAPGSFVLRASEHTTVWFSLLLVAITVGLLMPSVRLMVWLFFALWLLGFGATGFVVVLFDRLQPEAEWIPRERRFATSAMLGPTAALAWSMFVVFELLFHFYAANFVLFADITMFLTVMADEAMNMIFGPSAPWFLTALFVYALAASLISMILNRRVRSGRARSVSARGLTGVAAPGLLGLAALALVPTQEMRLILHHIHPQADDLAGFLLPGTPPGDRDRAAAERLYPSILANEAEQLAPVEVHRETLEQYGARAAGAQARHKHAIVVFIDTLSRRNLEAWGYDRAVAPNLKALADRSTRFDRARSNGGTTDLATVALFYGFRPLFGATKSETYHHGHGGLPFHLLAKAAGVRVGVFSGDWEVWDHGNAPLFPERCDRFLDARLAQEQEPDEIKRWSGLREDRVVEELITWLDSQDRHETRSLAYLKFLRPHIPYFTPERLPDGWTPPFLPQADGFTVTDLKPSAERQVLMRNRYDNSVHFVDHQLGRLLAYLDRSGRRDDTAIVVVADHGEAWGQHGWYTHGYVNYEEFLEVPLVVHQPGEEPRVDERSVGLMDVGPTVLDLLGLPPYSAFQGRSLLSGEASPVFWADSNSAARIATIQIDSWKYTENLLTTEASLFHMERDPQERTNLAYEGEHAERRAALRFLLYEGSSMQLAWARELREHSTVTLLGPNP